MVIVGMGTFTYLGTRQSRIAVAPHKPTQSSPSPQAFRLPGTLYLAQSGAIYSLSAGRFHQLTPEQGWSQPSLYPDGQNMLAIRRFSQYSNVFILSRFGQVKDQLTVNSAPAGVTDTRFFHWSFYPRMSLDEKTVFMSYDEPKFQYNVDLSIWSMSPYGTIHQGHLWTNSNGYTGGDIEPIPLKGGGIIYTKYGYSPEAKLVGQIWITNQAGSVGRALTTPEQDCYQPSISPDRHYVAMICSFEQQSADLMIAPFDGSHIGRLSEVNGNQLVAQPIWAPDGSGIAYLAPALPDGPFQLWFLPRAAYSSPAPSPRPSARPTVSSPGSPAPVLTPSPLPTPTQVGPIQITTDLGFDATSPMSWLS